MPILYQLSQRPRVGSAWYFVLRTNKSGYKIPTIENMGASRNSHDVIDLTDNDIQYLGNFPLMPRLQTLLVANNRISEISIRFSEYIPSLVTLVLTNNNISELGQLEGLVGLKKLTYLSLMDNPVVRKPGYRDWVCWRLPQVRVLDFKRIRKLVGVYKRYLIVCRKEKLQKEFMENPTSSLPQWQYLS